MYSEADKIFTILIATVGVVGVVIGYFIFSMVRLHRNYLLVHEQQDAAKIMAVEKERRLVAADLHDDICPILSATMFKLQAVNVADEKDQRLVEEAISHMDGIYVKVKQISSMLMPASLERHGPLHAIDDFASRYIKNHPIDIDIRPIVCEGLSHERALHVFRMLQEILHNTIKHAKAKSLIITGGISNDILTVITIDDGIGYNPKDKVKNIGLGLQNLQLRAQMINAKFVTETSPGGGTAYKIQLSLKE